MLKELHLLANEKRALESRRFFKIGAGEYGEGDLFIGVCTAEIRKLAKRNCKEITLVDISKILHSKIHEERALALMILVEKFQKTKDVNVVNFYLEKQNLKYVNNWDLVDLSSYKILGEYLIEKPEKHAILYELAKSESLWTKRIAIVSTY